MLLYSDYSDCTQFAYTYVILFDKYQTKQCSPNVHPMCQPYKIPFPRSLNKSKDSKPEYVCE